MMNLIFASLFLFIGAVLLGYPNAAVFIVVMLVFGWILGVIFRDAAKLQKTGYKGAVRDGVLAFSMVCGVTVYLFTSGVVSFDWTQMPFNFYFVALVVIAFLMVCVFLSAMLFMVIRYKIKNMRRRVR